MSKFKDLQVIKNIFFISFLAGFYCCSNCVSYVQVKKVNVKCFNKILVYLNKKINEPGKLDKLFIASGMININTVDTTLKINLKYADTNNFIHKKIYYGLKHAYLPKIVASQLCSAQVFLKKENPTISIIIFDATRPLHCQKTMWDSLKWPNYKKYNYIAPPSYKSLHNFGCAVDVGLIDLTTNQLLTMGTAFDTFDSLSQPKLESYFLKNKQLSVEAYKNRVLLRKAMKQAKFYGIGSEWWHFNFCTMKQAIQNFTLVP